MISENKKKLPDHFHNLKNIFLLIFIVGVLFLGFCGYGYFPDNLSNDRLFIGNPKIIFVVIPFLLPYIFMVLYQYFWEKNSEKNGKVNNLTQTEKLLKLGIPLTINFEKSIKEIRELDSKNELIVDDFEILTHFLFPFNNLFSDDRNKNEKHTIIQLKYKVKKKTFLKKIVIPFSKQSTIVMLKMQKETILYYNNDFPQESIIDLNFVRDYL